MAPPIERVAIVWDPGVVPAAENHETEADLPSASIGREETMEKTSGQQRWRRPRSQRHLRTAHTPPRAWFPAAA